ncbi:hypothetical protein V8E36_002630 [Tilletia maclaganii]
MHPGVELTTARKHFIGWHLQEHDNDELLHDLVGALLQHILQPLGGAEQAPGQKRPCADDDEQQSIFRHGAARKRARYDSPAPQPPQAHADGSIALLRKTIVDGQHALKAARAEAIALRPCIIAAVPRFTDRSSPKFTGPTLSPIDLKVPKPHAAIPLTAEDAKLNVTFEKRTHRSEMNSSCATLPADVRQILKQVVTSDHCRVKIGLLPSLCSAADEITVPNLGEVAISTRSFARATTEGRIREGQGLPFSSFPSADELAARVVIEEREPSAKRLLTLLEDADDISTLSVNTSQSSAKTNGGNEAPATDVLDTSVLASVCLSNSFDVNEKSVSRSSVAIFYAAGEGDALRPDIWSEYAASKQHAGRNVTVTSTDLLGRLTYARLPRDVDTTSPPLTAPSSTASSALDRLWQTPLSAASFCLCNAQTPSSVPELADGSAARWVPDLQPVKTKPMLEVELRSKGITPKARGLYHAIREEHAELEIKAMPGGATANFLRTGEGTANQMRLCLLGRILTLTQLSDDDLPLDFSTHHSAKAAYTLHDGQAPPPLRASDDASSCRPSYALEGTQSEPRCPAASKPHMLEVSGDRATTLSNPAATETSQLSGSHETHYIGQRTGKDSLLRAISHRKRSARPVLGSDGRPHSISSSMQGFLYQRMVKVHDGSFDTFPSIEVNSCVPAPALDSIGSDPEALQPTGMEAMVPLQLAVSSRMLQNSTVLSELRRMKVSFRECDDLDVDILCSGGKGMVFLKAALMAEALHDTAPASMQHNFACGWLRRLLQNARYKNILLVCEMYTTSGFPLDTTPPIQAAINDLNRLLSELATVTTPRGADSHKASLSSTSYKIAFARSAAEAAGHCRSFADDIEDLNACLT